MTSQAFGRTAAPVEPAASRSIHRPRHHERFELDAADPAVPRRSDIPPDVGEPARDLGWTRFALVALLLGTGALYLWDLSASGYANSFYAAAAQSASASWKAWFFGSLDLSNFITVDKPPASLWVMGLSGRIFGFSSWSLLAPQALEGVLAVWLLFLTVRRWSGATAGLVAGAALALTPAAALMFRFDNPDALLVLLMVAGAYCVVRAIEKGATGWLMLAGVAIGFAFLTKMMQGFLVLPAFALVYLVAAPVSLGRRLWQLVLALVAVLVSAGWWVAIVELWPASSRPYIGGSTNNNVLELVFGYNGLGRLFGSTGNGGGGGGGGGAAGSSFGGATGLTRLFSSEMGNEISWLIPAALIALLAGLFVTRSASRTDRTRAALILWGGWFIVTALVFSYMKGTIHPYYTVALAPAIAALIAIGGRALWLRRSTWTARLSLAAMVLASGLWSFELLARNADWYPVLRYAVLVLSLVVAFGIALTGAGSTASATSGRRVRRSMVALMIAAVLTAGAGSAAYAVATAASPHSGSIPSAGPTSAASSTGGMGGGGGMPSGTRPTGTGGNGSATSSSSSASATDSTTTSTTSSASSVDELLGATSTTWAAATVGDQSAATLQLSSGKAVMAIGGWSGSDAAPTLAQFKQYVDDGKISYFVVSGGMGGGGGQGSNGVGAQITSWVESTFTATTVGGTTVYTLTS